MKVRVILWYRTEGECDTRNHGPVLSMYLASIQWYQYNFLATFFSVSTRKEFKRLYLEWKAINEG